MNSTVNLAAYRDQPLQVALRRHACFPPFDTGSEICRSGRSYLPLSIRQSRSDPDHKASGVGAQAGVRLALEERGQSFSAGRRDPSNAPSRRYFTGMISLQDQVPIFPYLIGKSEKANISHNVSDQF